MDPRRFAEAEKLEDFSKGNGCGIRNAWKLYSVNGVRLSQPAIMNCAMANVLSRWVVRDMQPAARRILGAEVSTITVAASYSCRPRNNKRGAKLSEHGHGNAIDISGFTFSNGSHIDVEQGWFASRRHNRFLQQVRGAACGPFRTVLGPGADRSHKDHLHFDLQQHRIGGSYCR